MLMCVYVVCVIKQQEFVYKLLFAVQHIKHSLKVHTDRNFMRSKVLSDVVDTIISCFILLRNLSVHALSSC